VQICRAVHRGSLASALDALAKFVRAGSVAHGCAQRKLRPHNIAGHNRHNRVLHQNTVRVGADKRSRKNGLESYGGPAHHGVKHCWT
jgi:hypothetical protein